MCVCLVSLIENRLHDLSWYLLNGVDQSQYSTINNVRCLDHVLAIACPLSVHQSQRVHSCWSGLLP